MHELERAKCWALRTCERERTHFFIFLDPETDQFMICAHEYVLTGQTHAWVNPTWILWSTLWGDVQWNHLRRVYEEGAGAWCF